MKHCKYCAQTTTKLDGYGYCVEYNCFEVSGMKKILDGFIERAGKVWTLDKSSGLSIRSYVSNSYNPRDRAAQDIKYDCEKVFGNVPHAVIEALPYAQRKFPKWDRNIRW